ncbi:MAG: putative two-component sensor histidine kinase protein [Verrucomicrobiales bacterium]|nr:putative two-component sensor histidine kinase protein [Verrucomicrobiales bacterium]
MPELSFVLNREEEVCHDSIHLAPTPSWDTIGKSEHFVQFYEKDACLIDSVSAFFAKGFNKGEPAIVIATKEHRQDLMSRLSAEGFDVEKLKADGTLTSLDAKETLEKFMIEGSPDASLFKSVVGRLVERTSRRGAGLRAFGEMVAILCGEGNSRGAIQLEELWNDLGKEHLFALFCAYPLHGFKGETDGQPFAHICKAHTRVIPTESYARTGSTEDDRLREITRLQQKAASLEAEIAIRKKCQEELERRETELRDFLENATEGIHQVNVNGKILWANRSELELLGYKEEEYVGHDISEFHADPEVIEDILFRLKRGEKLHDYEARVKHKDGSIRYVSINSSVLWSGDKFSYTRCFTRDITARRKAEEILETTVKERTAQLQETVADLEAFSYSISHDMRSPLRAMQAYAASILEDYCGKPLDEEGVERLSRIQRSATRMDLLIRDVLAYSQVAKAEIKLSPIRLAPLVADILDEQFGSERAKGWITVGGLHAVCGHDAYLTQCISNLIGNALKFVAPGNEPKVRIWSECLDGQVKVLISDEGVGILAEHHDRIFKIFGRVYPEKQYSGTGIGLAIVNKAVARMGGKLGYNSEPGMGTTFWFTLPSGGES